MEELIDEHDYYFKEEIDEVFIGLKSLDPSEERKICYTLIEQIKKDIQGINYIKSDNYSRTRLALTTAIAHIKNNIRYLEKTSMRIKTDTTTLKDCIICLQNASNIICDSIVDFITEYKRNNSNYILNSDKFYKNKIEQITKEKQELSTKINDITKELKSTNDESKKARKELKEKEQELNWLMNKYKAEMLQNEKINDVKDEWEKKIIKAFENLKKYIKPIKNEHKRLGFLFWGYLGLSVVIVLCLFIIEYIICCKIEAVEGFPTWETYLSLILPIPIAMGGLWGFVTLMHRVQRQLVTLAKQIHEIEYVEGLLLTTNTLSTNINESMSKVNLAIEKLLENHLNYDGSTLTEELLLEKEEKKDAMPYEEVLKLVEKVAGMVSKNKE